MDRETDVVIVGGGLVGLSLAGALKSSRLSTLVVEAQPTPSVVMASEPARDGVHLDSGFEARVSAINPASKEFLHRLGGWPEPDRICPFTRMAVWDSRGTASIEFDADMIDEPALGYIVENRNLLAALSESARGAENVELCFGVAIGSIESTTDGYRLNLENGDTVQCRLLVGADGGNSLVRNECGVRNVKWSYGQDALVTSVQTELPHRFTARQCFTSIGSLAFLPLATPDEKICSIVWSTNRSQELLDLTDEELCERLSGASEQVLGNVVAVDKRFSFPLTQQHALRYVRPHLALIGDAAHTIHPLAGQGVNLGFADARTLATALDDCRFSGASPGDLSVLKDYQRRRQPFNLVMTAVMEGFKRLYEPGGPAINWIRNTGMKFVGGNETLKTMVMRVASGRY